MAPASVALRIAVAYAVFGSAWIVFSDRVLAALGLPRAVEQFYASVKGGVYVAVTSVALYVLALGIHRSLATARRAVQEQEHRIRQAYVDVLDAVTGGKLVLVTAEELSQVLGTPLSQVRSVSEPSELADARMFIGRIASGSVNPEDTRQAALAAGEALTNALVHGGSAEYQLLLKEGILQILVHDNGPGIDFRTLPKATLVPGFSTGQSLGMGFTIMLQLSVRVYIQTSGAGTTVVLEFE